MKTAVFSLLVAMLMGGSAFAQGITLDEANVEVVREGLTNIVLEPGENGSIRYIVEGYACGVHAGLSTKVEKIAEGKAGVRLQVTAMPCDLGEIPTFNRYQLSSAMSQISNLNLGDSPEIIFHLGGVTGY